MKKALYLIVSYYKSNWLLNHGFPTYEPTNLVQPISTKTSFVSLCSVATLKPSLSNRFGKPTNEIIKPFHFHFIDYKMKNLSVFFFKKLDGPSWPTVHKDRNYHLQKERRVNRGCAVESHSCLDTCPSSIFFKVRPAGFFVWQVSTTRHSFDGSTVKKASWWRRVQSSFGFIFMFLTPSIIAYIFPHASTASYPPNLTSLTILAPQPPRKTTVNVIFNGDAMPPSCLIVASRLIVFFF